MERYKVAWIAAFGLILLDLLVAYAAWNILTVHITSVDPKDGVLPTVQKNITIQYNKDLSEVKIISMSPEHDYSLVKQGSEVKLALKSYPIKDTNYTIKVYAKSGNQTSVTDVKFKAQYISFDKLSIAEQEYLAKDSDTFQDTYPLAGKLPMYGIIKPFEIDYGKPKDGETVMPIIIRNSTPEGREAALDWIRQQGVEPAMLRITFEGYENPLGVSDE